MRLRVVCGLGEMMASFSPTRALSSVDLPALGRPRMQTKPERKGMRAASNARSAYCIIAHRSVLSAHSSNQFQLLRLNLSHAHALDLAVGRFQDFEAQAVIFHNLALSGNAPGQLAHQAGDSSRFLAVRLGAEEFVETIDIHVSGNDKGALAFAHNFRLVALVSNLADDFFNQILNGDQSRHAAVFIDDDRHADILLLHLAQQFASQLAFGDEVHVPPHERIKRARMRLGIGNLQHILRVDDSLNVVHAAFVHRHSRVVLASQHLDEALDGGIYRDGEHGRTGPHSLADGFSAELNDRLNQVAVALLNNSLFLPSFDQGIDSLCRALRLLGGALASQRYHGLEESKDNGHWQHEVNQKPEQQRPMNQPVPFRA